MGALMAACDWSATPLGPPEGWPPSLRTAVRIILASRYPMFIWWGPDLVNLYNDAYIPVLGARHPQALGQPARRIWAEIWPVIGPRTNAVLERGDATLDRDLLLLMERYGVPEETYFTFSYSPLPGDAGGIAGVFCACTEETQKVVGQRRLALLRDLAAGMARARTVDGACAAAAAALAADRRDLPFALLYLAEGDSFRLGARVGPDADHPACPPMVTAGGGTAAPWPLEVVTVSGTAVVVEDLDARFPGLPAGIGDHPPRSALVLPLAGSTREERAGALVLGLSPVRPLDEEFRGFADLVAGHVASALASARAHEEERRRAEALAEIDRAKTIFFSNVSHEFRTPLTLLLGPLEEALERTPDSPSADIREHLELAHRNGLRLLKLVNGLLDFARIEAGRLQAAYEPADLAALTADLAANFRSACERAGLTLSIDAPPLSRPVHLDRDLWETVILNLLSNAFKYTLAGGITVTVRESGDGARVCVRDTGIGIAAAELPRLFERFHRVEGAQGRSQEGSGIGLAMVRELVRLHGGTITVDSTPGRGSAFTITLPFGTAHLPAPAGRDGTPRPVAAAPVRAGTFVEEALRWLPNGGPAGRHTGSQPAPGPAAGKAAGGRVLLADDNADMRGYVTRLLDGMYEVEAVADGAAALAAARARRPDLVLSDVMMPGLDGFALLAALRADPATRDVPVVLLSARAGEEARVDGLDAGADDYLTKPFTARELVARVRSNLELARQRRNAAEAIRASDARFAAVVEQASAGLSQIDADGRFITANDYFCRLVGIGRDALPGVRMQDLTHPDDHAHSLPPFARALRDGSPYVVEKRFVRPGGGVVWVENSVTVLRDGKGRIDRLLAVTVDMTERKRAEAALRDSEERLRLAVGTTGLGIWDFDPVSGRRRWSDEFKRIIGIPLDRPADYDLFARLIHPDDREVTIARYQAAFAQDGDRLHEDEFRILRADTGEERWMQVRGRVHRDAGGAPVRAVGTLLDITERKRAEERQKLLLAELNHRVKNTLATVQSVAQQTLRGAATPDAFIDTFTGRLLALSQVHDLLTRESWHGASLNDVVRRTLAPYIAKDGHRIAVGGPELRLGPNAAVTLSMVFHELTTNAMKYGALAGTDGRIAIAWRMDGSAVDLTWTETGGPPVSPPSRRGFGSRLIERGVARELNASVSLDFAAGGVICRMRLPVSTKVMLP